nr:hypothetical protein [Tanacetum cinerariifolium]
MLDSSNIYLNSSNSLKTFDPNTGVDRSCISIAFSSLIDIIPTTLDHGYDVELANSRIIWVNILIRGCTLNFLNHPFNIDLMPVEMVSFDVIIGMDWSLKLRDTNIVAYTLRLHELVLLCPEAVPTEKNKVEAYIKGLPENIKGETTSPRQKEFLRETKVNGKTYKVTIETTTSEETIKTTPATNNTTTREGQDREPPVRKCTFSSFMKCNPTPFHGKEGAIELCRWFKKSEMVFSISDCAKRNKVNFAAATLHTQVAKVKHTIPKLKWKTEENFHDYGIFTMLHMETFDGRPASNLDCGLPVESQLHRDMLRRLRFKFATKILLHEINVHAGKMLELAKEFDKTDHVKKMAIIVDAFKKREERDFYLESHLIHSESHEIHS